MTPEWQTNTGKISKPCILLNYRCFRLLHVYLTCFVIYFTKMLLHPLYMWIHFDKIIFIFFRTLRSRPTPLAWLINKAMVAKQGQSWPSNKCQAWYAKDMMDTSWLRSLPACPCNLHQALVDFGRWQKDPVCHLDSRTPDNCALHFTAVHCVRSVRPNK